MAKTHFSRLGGARLASTQLLDLRSTMRVYFWAAAKGRTDHEMPKLHTSKDYTKYINQRTAAWQKSEENRRVARASKRPRPALQRSAAVSSTGPAHVVILRHGEKPQDPRNPNLSPTGEKRADMLATTIPQIFPHPDFLFAAAPSKNSNRPVETLMPLARALTMPLASSIADNDYEVLAADLFEKPDFAGKLIIVCWHHGDIPDLALALKVPKAQIKSAQGMDGMHWDSAVFDLFWSIRFTGRTVSLTVTKQPSLRA